MIGGAIATGSGKAKRVGASSTTASICGSRASAFSRDCACRALVALARKRSTNSWMWARCSAMRSAARACWAARSVRMRTKASNPPGVRLILPRSRCAMACTQWSSRSRSWETTSAAPGNRCSQDSSHSVASRSRWLVGSSSSSRSGSRNSAEASATRIRQPPENELTGRACAAASNPSPAQDGRGPRRRRIGADRDQPVMDFGEPRGRRMLGLRQQRQPLGIGGQHGLQQRGVAGRRLLRHPSQPGAGGEPDLAAVGRDLAGDGAQQGRFARAIAPDQPDPPPRLHGQVGAVQQRAAGDAKRQVAQDQQAHGAAVSPEPYRREGLGGGKGLA